MLFPFGKVINYSLGILGPLVIPFLNSSWGPAGTKTAKTQHAAGPPRNLRKRRAVSPKVRLVNHSVLPFHWDTMANLSFGLLSLSTVNDSRVLSMSLCLSLSPLGPANM